jgi:hypothetical protein
MECFFIILIALLVIIIINNCNFYENKIESFNTNDPFWGAKMDVNKLKKTVEDTENELNIIKKNVERKKNEISNCIDSLPLIEKEKESLKIKIADEYYKYQIMFEEEIEAKKIADEARTMAINSNKMYEEAKKEVDIAYQKLIEAKNKAINAASNSEINANKYIKDEEFLLKRNLNTINETNEEYNRLQDKIKELKIDEETKKEKIIPVELNYTKELANLENQKKIKTELENSFKQAENLYRNQLIKRNKANENCIIWTDAYDSLNTTPPTIKQTTAPPKITAPSSTIPFNMDPRNFILSDYNVVTNTTTPSTTVASTTIKYTSESNNWRAGDYKDEYVCWNAKGKDFSRDNSSWCYFKNENDAKDFCSSDPNCKGYIKLKLNDFSNEYLFQATQNPITDASASGQNFYKKNIWNNDSQELKDYNKKEQEMLAAKAAADAKAAAEYANYLKEQAIINQKIQEEQAAANAKAAAAAAASAAYTAAKLKENQLLQAKSAGFNTWNEYQEYLNNQQVMKDAIDNGEKIEGKLYSWGKQNFDASIVDISNIFYRKLYVSKFPIGDRSSNWFIVIEFKSYNYNAGRKDLIGNDTETFGWRISINNKNIEMIIKGNIYVFEKLGELVNNNRYRLSVRFQKINIDRDKFKYVYTLKLTNLTTAKDTYQSIEASELWNNEGWVTFAGYWWPKYGTADFYPYPPQVFNGTINYIGLRV